MSSTVSFEVYGLIGGRWEFQARFGANDQERAIAEAKTLHRESNVTAVKVVKEVFNPTDNTTTEKNIFYNAKKRDQIPANRTAGGAGAAGGGGRAGAGGAQRSGSRSQRQGQGRSGQRRSQNGRRPPPKGKATQAKVEMSLVGKLAIAVGGSIVLGIIVAAVVDAFAGAKSTGGLLTDFSFLSFALSFLFALVASAWVLLTRQELDYIMKEEHRRKERNRQKGRPGTGKRRSSDESVDWDEERRRDLAGQDAHQQALDEQGLPDFEEDKAKEEAERNEASEALLREIEAELADEEEGGEDEKKKKKKKEEEEEEEEGKEEPADEEEEQEGELNLVEKKLIEDAQKNVTGFVGDSVKYAAANSPYANDGKLDAYSMFGCHIFLAGATSGYSQSKGLGEHLRKPILEKVSEAFSKSKKRAEQFTKHYEDYLIEDKNQEIFRSGQEAMQKHLAGDSEGGGRYLVWALDSWNQRRSQNKNPVAVLFTDIVGSTQFTQEHGDEESHRMVTAHNAIVRESLRYHNGREVKHTGDGIMASFSDPNTAVPSAIAIMRGIVMHNQMNPNRQIHLRISINAGEPIEEGGDFFGSTVQLSARINSLCNTDQILVSDVMRTYTKDKSIGFVDYGQHNFKGFKEPIQIYEVPWQE